MITLQCDASHGQLFLLFFFYKMCCRNCNNILNIFQFNNKRTFLNVSIFVSISSNNCARFLHRTGFRTSKESVRRSQMNHRKYRLCG